uniref:T cell receptor associated transmembrane adaptor 1 n=1 Tax=Bubo bubo TaxID=30461 RepID=A0A8C0EI78_BUBBB
SCLAQNLYAATDERIDLYFVEIPGCLKACKLQLKFVESTSQMCYASLDHSVKGKRRKPRRKKNPSLQEDGEERSSTTTTMASKVSIYLNSEQLAAENTANVEAIHDDPIRLMGLICIREPTKILANDL